MAVFSGYATFTLSEGLDALCRDTSQTTSPAVTGRAVRRRGSPASHTDVLLLKVKRL